MLRDPGPFETGCVPSDLQRRESTIEELSHALEPALSGYGNATRIVGPPGVGKTATMRYLLEQIGRGGGVATCYIDAWEHRDAQGFLFDVVGQLVRETTLTRSAKRGSLLEGVREAVTEPTILVIDEADMLTDRSLFVHLQDVDELSLILIANRREAITTGLDPAQSLMVERGECLAFTSYSVDDLVAILRPRAHEGIRGPVDEAILEAIAEEAHGDARSAIKCLEFAARRAEHEGRSSFAPKFVRSTMPFATSWVRRKDSSRLRPQERVVKEIVQEAGSIQMGDLYPRYSEAVDEDTREERTVRNWLGKMADYNMIRIMGLTSDRTYHWVPVGEELAPWLAGVA